MKTVAILQVAEGAQPEQIQALLLDEVRMAWEGMKSGVIRAAHYLANGSGGLLELETPDAGQAEDFVQALPLVAAGLVTCTTYPLAPYAGLDLLLSAAPPAQQGAPEAGP
ncbi:MAG: hypothetical protein ACKOD3_10585 [Phenylobacterium sp.]